MRVVLSIILCFALVSCGQKCPNNIGNPWLQDHMGYTVSVPNIPLHPYTPLPYEPSEWESLYKFDENGVVMVYRTKEDKDFYNPVTISQYALANFKAYAETNDKKYKEMFLAQSLYLKTHYQEIDESKTAYPYSFSFEGYGNLTAPWYSAMAQGQVLNVLAAEYRLTQDQSLKPLMTKIKNFMLTPISEGGTLAKTPEGYLWLEEYATEPAPLVLNGHFLL